ncbi:hypothetical protein ANN_17583 [Periplaneta americana]|uniref:DUF4817 domain-containing protein n=1 Tax=Periplaneta americana TaxID=6978 RepID=A0ABQ8STD0_PERAM|nr:hypothetical protein ANN_17583 [Periplaneta americana]
MSMRPLQPRESFKYSVTAAVVGSSEQAPTFRLLSRSRNIPCAARYCEPATAGQVSSSESEHCYFGTGGSDLLFIFATVPRESEHTLCHAVLRARNSWQVSSSESEHCYFGTGEGKTLLKTFMCNIERIPSLSAEQSDGITVFRISIMTSLMLHRFAPVPSACRGGGSLHQPPSVNLIGSCIGGNWQTNDIVHCCIMASSTDNNLYSRHDSHRTFSSFVPISLQRDVIVVHRSAVVLARSSRNILSSVYTKTLNIVSKRNQIRSFDLDQCQKWMLDRYERKLYLKARFAQQDLFTSGRLVFWRENTAVYIFVPTRFTILIFRFENSLRLQTMRSLQVATYRDGLVYPVRVESSGSEPLHWKEGSSFVIGNHIFYGVVYADGVLTARLRGCRSRVNHGTSHTFWLRVIYGLSTTSKYVPAVGRWARWNHAARLWTATQARVAYYGFCYGANNMERTIVRLEKHGDLRSIRDPRVRPIGDGRQEDVLALFREISNYYIERRTQDEKSSFTCGIIDPVSSVIVTQRAFRQHFDIHQNDSVPSSNTIFLWVRNFRETACATKKKPPGKQRTVRTPENVERVRHAVLRSPRRSAVKQASAVGISDRSVRRILHMDLHFHPYKIVTVQELSERDKRTRSVCCNELLTTVNDQVLNQLLMTDEANFHVCGYVNTHNCRFWASDNPQEMHERPLHSEKVVVWCGVASFGIIGPYFFEDGEGRAVTVTSQRYINMLQTFLAPELRQRVIADVTWFQQDGATAHTSRASMGGLREMFGARVILHRVEVQWPPRSPDLNACDYFLWGYLKSRVYQDRPRTNQDLKRNIRTEVAAISPDVLQRVMRSLPLRLQECADNDGHHLRNTIFKKFLCRTLHIQKCTFCILPTPVFLITLNEMSAARCGILRILSSDNSELSLRFAVHRIFRQNVMPLVYIPTPGQADKQTSVRQADVVVNPFIGVRVGEHNAVREIIPNAAIIHSLIH